MEIYDIPCVKGFIRMCNDGWLQGWHERNGGNLTYRMTEEDVAACRPYFDETPREWVKMGVQADNLAGEYFITTGSGKYFRNVEPDPIHSIGIVEINATGDSWRIVWGLACHRPDLHSAADRPGLQPRFVAERHRVPRGLPRGCGRLPLDGTGRR